MNNRYKGDQLGEIDGDGIAQWYPKCKVRKEGDVYIATPIRQIPRGEPSANKKK